MASIPLLAPLSQQNRMYRALEPVPGPLFLETAVSKHLQASFPKAGMEALTLEARLKCGGGCPWVPRNHLPLLFTRNPSASKAPLPFLVGLELG